MKHKITVNQFVKDLLERIETSQTIDCCKDEIKTFAKLAQEKMGNEKIEVDWKEPPKS